MHAKIVFDPGVSGIVALGRGQGGIPLNFSMWENCNLVGNFF